MKNIKAKYSNKEIPMMRVMSKIQFKIIVSYVPIVLIYLMSNQIFIHIILIIATMLKIFQPIDKKKNCIIVIICKVDIAYS